jgi:hypothetical protein
VAVPALTIFGTPLDFNSLLLYSEIR